jgi:hypothetical protein
MGSLSGPKFRPRRWVIALALVAGACTALWLWWKQAIRIELNPALAAGTQSAGEPGVTHPDFRGEWKLDVEASDSVDPLLKAKGIGFARRMAMVNLPVTNVIRGDHRRLFITVRMTPIIEQTEELPTDGTPTKSASPEDGKLLDSQTRWSADGQSLITTTVDEMDGKPIRLTVTRSLAPDRRTMYVDFRFQPPTGGPLEARRVFRLVKLPDEDAGGQSGRPVESP